jgi:predicted FMN-binding regulatory protein PaiB
MYGTLEHLDDGRWLLRFTRTLRQSTSPSGSRPRSRASAPPARRCALRFQAVRRRRSTAR